LKHGYGIFERKQLKLPIASEGWPFILPAAGAAIIFAAVGPWWLAAPTGVLALIFALFFRDPERETPNLPGVIVAPADGKVVQVHSGVPAEFVGRAARVSIFLSPLDVHVNRSPIAGLITDVRYQPGKFLPAYRAEAGEVNEQCSLSLQGEAFRVLVRQIAGVLARRIVCRVRPGGKLALGDRFGMIKFGSRVDLFIPDEVRLHVKVGDRVRAGESVIGVMG
jgi:phosphatidylserine decarboxylase